MGWRRGAAGVYAAAVLIVCAAPAAAAADDPTDPATAVPTALLGATSMPEAPTGVTSGAGVDPGPPGLALLLLGAGVPVGLAGLWLHRRPQQQPSYRGRHAI